MSRYADWKAPGEDSSILVWPQPAKLLSDTLANQKLLGAASARVQGIEIAELRRRQREWLKLDDSRPVIGTGHQTELYHPGVWSKLALLEASTAKVQGQGLHLAVDTDAPKHLQLRWPGWSQPITDDSRLNNAEWSGLLESPTAGHLHDLKSMLDVATKSWPFATMAGEFLDELSKQPKKPQGLSGAITEAIHRVDESLGLKHRATIVSPMFSSEPYLVLVHHLLARAGEFAAIYNRALGDYRKQHKLRTDAKPMPDLVVEGGQCETAFWMDELESGKRGRATVKRDEAGWALVVEGDRLALKADLDGWKAAEGLGRFLNEHHVRLSPRALTLTLFARLLVMDQFVHGIGGGRYDQVTDQVIAEFIGIEAPAFAVTTATLMFPTAVGQRRPCLPCLAHEGHRLRHGLLGKEKMEMVEQIAGLPRRSLQRQEAFNQMHARLNTAVATHPSVQKWEQRVAEANRETAEFAPLFDRELFYAIQPRERLAGVIEEYRGRF